MVKKKFGVKVSAMAMAAAMMLSLGVPVMAAAPIGAATEVKTVTVSNVEGASSIMAYRIVEPTFDATSHRLSGYKRATGVTEGMLADIEAPQSAEITNLVKAIKAGTLTLETTQALTISGNNAAADLPAGEWIVLVTDSTNAEYIYNPMVVSVQYDDPNDVSKMTAKGVDSTGSYDIGTEGLYAKRSSIPFDKTITSPDAQKAGDTDMTGVSVSGADDLQVGDTGHFQLTSKIPEYSAAYTQVTYEISDTQDDGFDAPTNIKIFVDNKEVTQSTDTAKATVTGNDFKVVFASGFALANAGKDVKVTYDAKLNSNAKMQLEANNNTATLKFTNDLAGTTTEKTDSVREYTFKIDGELIKVEKDNSPSIDGYVPLEGATFSIERVGTDGDHVAFAPATYVTGTDGKLKFDRLDEGTYKIKETAAPSGYSVNDTEYTVVITPTYEGEGKDAELVSYSVQVSYTDANGEAQSSTFVYGDSSTTNDASTTTTTKGGKSVISSTNAIQIIDVKLASLPATGAQGTVAFAVVGAVGMAAIAAMIARKKKEDSVEQ